MTNKNVVDGDMNQLNKIADKSHNDKANSGCSSSLSELYNLTGLKTTYPSYQA